LKSFNCRDTFSSGLSRRRRYVYACRAAPTRPLSRRASTGAAGSLSLRGCWTHAPMLAENADRRASAEARVEWRRPYWRLPLPPLNPCGGSTQLMWGHTVAPNPCVGIPKYPTHVGACCSTPLRWEWRKRLSPFGTPAAQSFPSTCTAAAHRSGSARSPLSGGRACARSLVQACDPRMEGDPKIGIPG
jgi:hypothetical protein